MESMKKQYLKSGFWMRKANQEKRKGNDDKKRWFMDNGSIFLKELVADCNGKSIPLRCFSSDQILRATNNFNSSCFISKDAYYKWYRGKIEDRSYMIKRFWKDKITEHRVKEVYNDFVLCARMSNQSNFLKLLGFCLEFPFPVLVFEDAEHGVLNQRGGVTVNGEESLLPLNLRLKIAKEIAIAVTYLHMAFPKIIIHRDVKPMHVFLDKTWTAKLSDLSFSITLPEGKLRIEAEWIIGTYGYLDPLYHATSYVTEYTDVYSFGICLLVFLTGKSVVISDSDEDPVGILSYVRGLCENGKVNEVIDPMLMKDITTGQRLLMEWCMVLALKCCADRDKDRPKMIQVAKELKRFESSLRDST